MGAMLQLRARRAADDLQIGAQISTMARMLLQRLAMGLALPISITCVAQGEPVIHVPEVVNQSETAAEQKLFSAYSDHFVVVAESMDAAIPVARLSGALSGLIRNWLVADYPTPEPLIAVQLIPPHLYSGAEDYYLTADGRGGFVLSFRWDDDLSLEVVCEGLARSFLARLLWQHDPTVDPTQIPDWLVFGVGKNLEISWLNGRRDAVYADAQLDPTLGLEDILYAAGPYGEQRNWVARESYLLLKFLQTELRGVSPQVWAQILRGEPFPWSQLDNVAGFLTDADARQLWWEVGRTHILKSRVGPVLSLSDSRLMCIRLTYITVERKEGDQRLTGQALVEYDSGDPQLQRIFQDRIRMIKLALPRMNPVYYNAMVSLGRFYELLGSGDAEAAYEAYLLFAHDFTAAERLHQSAESLLYDH